MTIEIRPAVPSDAAQILTFITELADYEKARHEVIASVVDIERSLFSEGATAHGLICLRDGLPIGFAVFFSAIPRGWAATACTSKTCTSTPSNAVAGRARSCCATWRKSPVTTAAGVSSGACWTGTSRPSRSTNPSVPSPRKSGYATAWKATPSGISHRVKCA